jgi:hypothetical protein
MTPNIEKWGFWKKIDRLPSISKYHIGTPDKIHGLNIAVKPKTASTNIFNHYRIN